MGLTAKLAERGLRPADSAAADHLRMLTASNMAAGQGCLGRAGELVRQFPIAADHGSAAETHRVAAVVLHARTQDDLYPHGRVHVGAITLAATLALADEDEARLLVCLATGYEVKCLAAECAARHIPRLGVSLAAARRRFRRSRLQAWLSQHSGQTHAF